MNIQELRKITQNKLIEYNIEDASVKADLLICNVLNINKVELFLKYNESISKEIENIVNKGILEILNGKPIQYIINKQEFMGLQFYVDENVLIPQPDTEMLVDEAIKGIFEIYIKRKEQVIEKNDINKEKNSNRKIKILDLCTGSGAVAIAIDKYIKESIKQGRMKNLEVEIVATDISESAIEVARKNAKIHNANIKFIVSDMFNNINGEDFDIVVSNPPYIETEIIATLLNEVQNEPYIALDGGEDGLDFYKIIASQGFKYLKNNGKIIVEIGYNQREKVMQLFRNYKEYVDISCFKDLSGNDRVIEVSINKLK